MKIITLLLLIVSLSFAQFKGWKGFTGWIPDEWCGYLFEEDASTVAHWVLLDENPDGLLADVSDNGHTLTANGGVGGSYIESPYCGNAVEFDGVDDIYTSIISLDSSDFTVEAIFKIDTSGSSYDYCIHFGSSTININWYLLQTNKVLYMHMRGSSGTATKYRYMTSDNGKYIYLTFVVDRDVGASLFIRGSGIEWNSSMALDTSPDDWDSKTFRIGGYSSYYWDSAIVEVMVSKRLKTSLDVVNHWNKISGVMP